MILSKVYEDAERRLERNEITLGEFERLVDIEVIEPKQGEWIPCGERLPEEREWIGTKKFGTTISDEVLVTFESRGERFVRPIHFQNGELGGMDKHTMDAVHGEWKAVAWMPLPEPWKGADDERDYERAIEQMQHDILYEPTYNPEDGSM